MCARAPGLIRVFTDGRSGGNEETKGITGTVAEIKSESGVSTFFKAVYSELKKTLNLRVRKKRHVWVFFDYKTASAGIVFIS